MMMMMMMIMMTTACLRIRNWFWQPVGIVLRHASASNPYAKASIRVPNPNTPTWHFIFLSTVANILTGFLFFTSLWVSSTYIASTGIESIRSVDSPISYSKMYIPWSLHTLYQNVITNGSSKSFPTDSRECASTHTFNSSSVGVIVSPATALSLVRKLSICCGRLGLNG